MLQEERVQPSSHQLFDQQDIDKIIDLCGRNRSNLIQILHQIQNVQGFLPLETLRQVAIKLDMPLSEIAGVEIGRAHV